MRRVLMVIAMVGAAVGVTALMVRAPDAFLLFFAGILAALFLNAPAAALRRHRGISHGWSLTLVIVIVAAIIAAAIWLLLPSIINQISDLGSQLPTVIGRLEAQLQRWPGTSEWFHHLPARFSQSGLLWKAPGALFGALGSIGNGVLIAFLALFLAADPSLYREGFLRLLPPARRPRINEVLLDVGTTLQRWLWGKLILMAAAGLMTGFSLWGLGIPLPLALGVLAGVAEFIPNLGPVVAAVPAILLGFTQSPEKALSVAAAYIGVQTAQSYMLTPWVQKKAVRLPPAMLLIGQIAMTILFGLFGLAMATPLLAAALVTVRELYVKDVLESPSVERPPS